MTKVEWLDRERLRARAEEVVRRRLSSGEAMKLETSEMHHELEVHAAELEMQNEALREAHRELEASRAAYRELFDLAPVAYVAVGSGGRFHAANLAASALFGMRCEEILGLPLCKFVSAKEAEAFERHQREVVGSTDRIRATFTVIGRDGVPRTVRFESQCTDAVLGEWRTALIDTTETKELERQLWRTERLGVLGTRASGIVHDFKNILTSMLTSAEIALRHLDPDHPARRPLERLKQTGHRGALVVGQVLAFTRGEGTEPGFIDLNRFIPSIEPVLRAQLGKDVDVRLDLSAPDASVRADSGQVEQILLNLASNALHAMPTGGIFAISTWNVEVREDDPGRAPDLTPGRYVVMTVSDTGVGMDVDTRARAFEPFFTTKPSGRGSGLGLPLVRAVAQQAGGHTVLESEPGRGTTVTVYFPRASGFLRTPSERPSVSEPLPGDLAIVIVADEPDARKSVREYFRAIGCHAFDAGDGFDALKVLRSNRERPVVMLVDTELPNLSRPEFAKAAQAIVPSLHVVSVPIGTRISDAWSNSDASQPVFATLYDAVVSALSRPSDPKAT